MDTVVTVQRVLALAELLVDTGLARSPRQANGLIRRGEVSVEGLRVANPQAILIVTDPTTITAGGASVVVAPRTV